jgi:hypothetical protein
MALQLSAACCLPSVTTSYCSDLHTYAPCESIASLNLAVWTYLLKTARTLIILRKNYSALSGLIYSSNAIPSTLNKTRDTVDTVESDSVISWRQWIQLKKLLNSFFFSVQGKSSQSQPRTI